VEKYLKYTLIAGLLAFIIELPSFIVTTIGFDNIMWYISNPQLLISIKNFSNGLILRILFLMLYAIYLCGYIIISKKSENKLMFHLSYLWILNAFLANIFGWIKLYDLSTIFLFIGGLLSLLWGIAFIKLKGEFGKYVLVTGIIISIMGLCNLSYFLQPLGSILLIPSWILELIFVFLAYRKYKVA